MSLSSSSRKSNKHPTPTSQPTTPDTAKKYSCEKCGFTTARIGVITMHAKSHVSDPVITPHKKVPIQRTPVYTAPEPLIEKKAKKSPVLKRTPKTSIPKAKPPASTSTPRKVYTPRKRRTASPKKEALAKDILDDWKDSDDDVPNDKEAEELDGKIKKRRTDKDYKNIFDNLLQTKQTKESDDGETESNKSPTSKAPPEKTNTEPVSSPIKDTVTAINNSSSTVTEQKTLNQDYIAESTTEITTKGNEKLLQPESVQNQFHTSVGVSETIEDEKLKYSITDKLESVKEDDEESASPTEKDPLLESSRQMLAETDKDIAALEQLMKCTSSIERSESSPKQKDVTCHQALNISNNKSSPLKAKKDTTEDSHVEQLPLVPSPTRKDTTIHTESVVVQKNDGAREEEKQVTTQDDSIQTTNGQTVNGQETRVTNDIHSEHEPLSSKTEIVINKNVQEDALHLEEKLSQGLLHENNEIVNGECSNTTNRDKGGNVNCESSSQKEIVSPVEPVAPCSTSSPQKQQENKLQREESDSNNVPKIQLDGHSTASNITMTIGDSIQDSKFENIPQKSSQVDSAPMTESAKLSQPTVEPKKGVPVEQVVHLVPVQNPDGSVQCMFISLGDSDELKIAETESAVPPPSNLEAIYIDKAVDCETLMQTLTQQTTKQQQQLLQSLQHQQQIQLQQDVASQAPSRQPPISHQFKQVSASSAQQHIQLQQIMQQQQYVQEAPVATQHYQIIAGDQSEMQVITEVNDPTVAANEESHYVMEDYNPLIASQQQQYVFVMEDGTYLDPSTVSIDLQQLLSQQQQQ